MKKVLLSASICLICIPVFSQWTSNGSNISTTQNVGIGTDSPIGTLHLHSAATSVLTMTYPGSGSAVIRSNNNVWVMGIAGNSSIEEVSLGTQSGEGQRTLVLAAGGAARLKILANGNIGIGTSSPEYKLDVNGDLRLRNLALPGGNQISMNLLDNLIYQGRSMGHYALGWMPDSWCPGANTLWQSGYGGIKFFTQGQFRLAIHRLGNVGIGTDNPTQKLDVDGNIRGINIYANGTVFANEVKVETTKWPDFVFDKEYRLLSLEEVKAHIAEHKHLPDVPSGKQVIEEGINVAEMQAKLLQKIEELTLYVIQQDAKNKELEQEIKELKVSLSKE